MKKPLTELSEARLDAMSREAEANLRIYGAKTSTGKRLAALIVQIRTELARRSVWAQREH